ncbi:hypothetical protein O4220_02430 [Rhodococcus ruber]|uniref:Uncharacterized protein n=1 Tax=Rhodococcus ruber TaxID=1830 RepID=A0ABT4M9H0_9NOCA|nr:hypothetical protein [Rhodococcus ruber]MCZ4517354.1 hypothetical protein [Rhodococcus ruber]
MSTAVSRPLRGAEGGVDTARIVLPGRAKVASVQVSDSNAGVGIELDADGRQAVVPP